MLLKIIRFSWKVWVKLLSYCRSSAIEMILLSLVLIYFIIMTLLSNFFKTVLLLLWRSESFSVLLNAVVSGSVEFHSTTETEISFKEDHVGCSREIQGNAHSKMLFTNQKITSHFYWSQLCRLKTVLTKICFTLIKWKGSILNHDVNRIQISLLNKDLLEE